MFFFAQANWQKIQEFELAVECRKDKYLKKKVKSFIALALIPECDDLKLVLETLYPKTTANDSYFEFFKKTWVVDILKIAIKMP